MDGGRARTGSSAGTIRPMRIGFVATRLAGVDGVTFETAKWEIVVERMGHQARLLAGEIDALYAEAKKTHAGSAH